MGGGDETGQEFSLNNLYYNRKPKSVTSFNSPFLYLQTVHSEAEDALASDCIVCKHKECDLGT